MQPSLAQRLGLLLAPPVYGVLSLLLFGSCRIKRVGPGLATIEHRLRDNQPVIVCFWHYGVFLFPYLARGNRWVAMASASSDGEYIARILERQGHRTVRGSANRGGVAALKNLIRAMAVGHNAVLVADGSQGPARRLQAGPLLLAAKTGFPIIPVNWAADRYWLFSSWDHTVLPKPMARIVVNVGEPLTVPAASGKPELADYGAMLEQRLETAYHAAWGALGRQEHWPRGR